MKIKATLRKWADRWLGPTERLPEPITWRTSPPDGYSVRIVDGDIFQAAYEARSAVMQSYGKIQDYRFKVGPITYQLLKLSVDKYGVLDSRASGKDVLLGIPLLVDPEVGSDYIWIVKTPKLYDPKSGVREVIRLDYS